jgi:hypothetical protein
MYFVMVALLLVILPAGSVAAELLRHSHEHLSALSLAGRWWTFWAVGVRLLIAGVRQVVQPRFTAVEIFGAHEPASLPIVREVGFGNLAFGTAGFLSLFRPDWVVPAALVGGLYYGLAGLGHIPRKNKNALEWMAMISDLGVFILLAVFVCGSVF